MLESGDYSLEGFQGGSSGARVREAPVRGDAKTPAHGSDSPAPSPLPVSALSLSPEHLSLQRLALQGRWLLQSAPPPTSQPSSHWALWPLAAGQGLFQEAAQREAQLQQRKDTTPPPPTFTGHSWLNTKLKG